MYKPDGSKLSHHTWHADRQLARDLLTVLHGQLHAQSAAWQNITGLVVFEGPGSFTGLRIGLTVGNAIAYGQAVPIVATQGDDWLQAGLQRLQNGDDDKITLPHYGAEANITIQKK